MNINELTIGQAKELAGLFGNKQQNEGIYNEFLGKYVICRTINEGINFGIVAAIDETGVVLDESRRLYYHKPINKNVSWYEGIARFGISSDSKVGTAVKKIISENYSLTLCTDEAVKSLKEAVSNEQS